ncbi:MAG: hypothetical protein PF501_19705 [Salinisphaera sp.]|jgi:hypothetical protein|nr:hypothetical protein [Salinisphaera sp.]
MEGDRPALTETEFSKLMQEQALALRVGDLFLFRRARGERFAHLGRLGRGVGWAGIIELDLADKEMAATATLTNDHVGLSPAPTQEPI